MATVGVPWLSLLLWLMMPCRRADLTSKHAVADHGVEQHQREDEKTLSPKHECKTGLRRCRFLDGKDERDHIGPEREGQGAKGAQEDYGDRKKGHFIPTVLNTEREQN